MKKILIARTDRVGDVVMITPMIRELKRTYPDSFIAALVSNYTSDILLHNPHLDDIIIDELDKNFWKTVKHIRKHKFTDGLLTWPIKRTAYQMFLGGVKNRIGVGRKLYEVITFMKSVSRSDYNPLRHEADYCMDLARRIGVESDDLTPEIFVTQEEKDSALEFLAGKCVYNTDKKIIIHTGYGRSSPNWSENKYFELTKEILERSGADTKLIFTAPEMTKKLSEKLTSLNSDRIIDLSRHTFSLRELIGLISVCDVVVSSSTGPMHLASAMGVNTVSIFCYNAMCRVKRWGALGNKAHNIEVASEFCRNNCHEVVEECRVEAGIGIHRVLNEILPLISHS
ncbi:MAG: glycosyltransferase family 9 protein [Ignavibacteriae bacterium]|nr:glycosyltransferase family 9 protein [Ignavibacteriota bacterium]